MGQLAVGLVSLSKNEVAERGWLMGKEKIGQ